MKQQPQKKPTMEQKEIIPWKMTATKTLGPCPCRISRTLPTALERRGKVPTSFLFIEGDYILMLIAVLPHEKLYLSHLPSAERYAKSFMHRDVLNFVTVTHGTDFVVTTSVDGHLKLWKKHEVGIEFVKHYRAHLQQVVGVSASADGTLFASVSDDGTGKVFDVVNFGASPTIHNSSVY